MVANNINHFGAALQMNTGEQAFSRPSLGSWVNYGLGTENQNLPSFVVIAPNPPFQRAPLWSSSFPPATYQGTWVRDPANPIADLKPETRVQILQGTHGSRQSLQGVQNLPKVSYARNEAC